MNESLMNHTYFTIQQKYGASQHWIEIVIIRSLDFSKKISKDIFSSCVCVCVFYGGGRMKHDPVQVDVKDYLTIMQNYCSCNW